MAGTRVPGSEAPRLTWRGPYGAGSERAVSLGNGAGCWFSLQRRIGGEEEAFGGGPVDALVGDGLAVGELVEGLGEVLVAGDEVAFEHRSDDGFVAGDALGEDFLEDAGHALVVLAAVGVGGIDHEVWGEAGLFEDGHGGGDAGEVVVGTVGSTAEDDVAVGVAGGGDGGGDALFGDAEEGLWFGGGADGVDGGDDIPADGVFEADGHGKAGGHLAVGLAFAGAGPDGGPGDEVGDVLGGDGVEEFGGGRDAEFDDLAEEAPGEVEALGDVVGAVEVGVHDEALPADGGAWFFEVNAHDEVEVVGDAVGEVAEAFGVFEAGLCVVDGAGADDDEEAGVLSGEDGADGFAGGGHEGSLGVAAGVFRDAEGRGGEGDVLNDVEVRDFRGGVHGLGGE